MKGMYVDARGLCPSSDRGLIYSARTDHYGLPLIRADGFEQCTMSLFE